MSVLKTKSLLEFIQAFREAQGLTQQEMADEFGVSRAVISNLTNQHPTVPRLLIRAMLPYLDDEERTHLGLMLLREIERGDKK